MDLWHFLGDLHPKLVHFPLVLLLAGLVLDLVGLIGRSPRAHWAGGVLTMAGTVALLLAFICGIYAEIWAGRAGVPHQQIEVHEFAANIASWGFVVLAAARLFLSPQRRALMALYLVVGFAWYGLIYLTARLGGSLVYDYGAGVVGAQSSPPVLSLHDLNTLASRQTDLNLRYSEWMHHVFGWLTLALAGSLMVQALLGRRGGGAMRIRWVVPLLLLAGGVFLFFFADLDLYRLSDWRQWRDREVQLHKTIALAMATVGAIGLVRARRNRSAPARVAIATSAWDDPGPNATTWQARLIAVMALIGGGMLFTHVHTVAPYANVAAGVYLWHITMGIVALLTGATALLGSAWPRFKRPLAGAFALLMCVEAILLITYNEGLPWYAGYGAYNRWSARGGTVAPYGAVRAELTFDPATQNFDAYVMHRHEQTPVHVPARELTLLVARGYQETAVTLSAADEMSHNGSSHFRGRAEFLRDAPAFCARMALPLGGGMKMGYFDPWVSPLVSAVPPNEVARFFCPMHEGIRSGQSGECSLCGMPLVPVASQARAALHDADYTMDVSFDPPGDGNAGEGLLTFVPRKSGVVVRDLATVHEHPLHLIIVSPDLRFFDHVHPQPVGDGSLQLRYRFPPDLDRLLLFAEITPRGAASQVFRHELTLPESGRTAPDPVLPTIDRPIVAKSLAADPTITAELLTTPRRLVAGMPVQLLFRLSRHGRPITELEPYLGAMGHCVIISADTQKYLHCHPEQLLAPRPDDRGGPEVAFHTRFDSAGRYKVWGQFQCGGKILIADFDLDVAVPPLPPRVMQFLFEE
jgi:uncharacterized membrane protein